MEEFFKKRRENAVFNLPESGIETRQNIEYRCDPLTGRTSVIGEGLLKKTSILFGETDYALIRELAENSRQNCFFCSPRVEHATPTYPKDICPDSGRMKGEQSLLFPNLFPLAELHTVLTWPDYHYLSPGEISPELLTDLFQLTGRFLVSVNKAKPNLRFLSLNSNYMPPAGASVLHPHFQLLGMKRPPHHQAEVIEASVRWFEKTSRSYWDDLIEKERETGDRQVGETGGWNWMAAWSPVGANEVIGVHHHASTLLDLTPRDWADLAQGLHFVLKEYERQHYSSFNICISGGCCLALDGQRCTIRIISRQNVKSMYRNDEYFLQKLHGIELIVSPPEDLADDLRRQFESR